jgi:hypothetical protein
MKESNNILDFLKLRDLLELLDSLSGGPVSLREVPLQPIVDYLDYLIEYGFTACEETEEEDKLCWLTEKGIKLHGILKQLEILESDVSDA